MRRHPKLSIRIPERVSKARAGVDEASLRVWFHNLQENLQNIKEIFLTLLEYSILTKCLFN